MNDDTLSVEAMREVCIGGPEHFLGHDQTLGVMQSHYVYPSLGDRSSPKEWVEIGRPDLVQEATKRKEKVLGTCFPDHLPRDIDRAVRERFKIHLPEAAVGV